MTAIIAAYSQKRVIGCQGKIPWEIPLDKKRFQQLTMGGTVIMGRKTYEEIGRPLPGRINIVISKTTTFDGCICVHSLEEALNAADGDVFIAGGSAVYQEAVMLADRMYLTEIQAEFDGDRFFPAFDEMLFEKISEEEIDGEIPCKFLTYVRK